MGFLTGTELNDKARLGDWGGQDVTWVSIHLPNAMITSLHHHIWLYSYGFWEPNSVPHDRGSVTEPSPQSWFPEFIKNI